MKGRIRRCTLDGTYTLHQACPLCGGPVVTPHPARYSPDDRYGTYRRIARSWTR